MSAVISYAVLLTMGIVIIITACQMEMNLISLKINSRKHVFLYENSKVFEIASVSCQAMIQNFGINSYPNG